MKRDKEYIMCMWCHFRQNRGRRKRDASVLRSSPIESLEPRDSLFLHLYSAYRLKGSVGRRTRDTGATISLFRPPRGRIGKLLSVDDLFIGQSQLPSLHPAACSILSVTITTALRQLFDLQSSICDVTGNYSIWSAYKELICQSYVTSAPFQREKCAVGRKWDCVQSCTSTSSECALCQWHCCWNQEQRIAHKILVKLKV